MSAITKRQKPARGKVNRRKSKQRDIQTDREVVAFKRGVKSHAAIVGPSIKRRAALMGLVLGLLAGGGLTELARYVLALWGG